MIIGPKQFERTESFAKQWCREPDSDKVTIAGGFGYDKFHSNVHDSSSGDDGLPFSAWRAAGIEGIEKTVGNLLVNESRGEDANWAQSVRQVFLLEGDKGKDDTCVARKPEDTRPLG